MTKVAFENKGKEKAEEQIVKMGDYILINKSLYIVSKSGNNYRSSVLVNVSTGNHWSRPINRSCMSKVRAEYLVGDTTCTWKVIKQVRIIVEE